jgi:quercetin dioxygenase-like cupin family protein
VSAASIHKIERNGMVPTITTLLKLTASLDLPLMFFIDADQGREPAHFTPAAARPPVFTSPQGLQLAGISGPYGDYRCASAMATVEPGADSGEKLLLHPGEELVHVLTGAMRFTVNGVDYDLGPGDSIHFSGNMPHRWQNPGDVATRALWTALRE